MSEREEILELYKIHVEMIDRVSQRRGALNQFYISILSGLLGVVAFAIDKHLGNYEKVVFIAIGALGIIACCLWVAKIHSYKQLNSAKFKVLDKIEDKLSFSFYKQEWTILNKEKKYLTLTNLEKFSPIIFMIPYFILLIYGLSK
jgi:hypothetical protein